jgi:hypothetical protein
MSETPAEQATIVFKTGHKLSFSFFAFRQIPGGYEFIDYPDQKGYKTVRLIRSDAIASIEVTAREQELDAFSLVPAQPSAAPLALAPGVGYVDGDPQHGPKTYVARDPRSSTMGPATGRDEKANRGTYTPTPKNPLRSEIVGDAGGVETVDAAMV